MGQLSIRVLPVSYKNGHYEVYQSGGSSPFPGKLLILLKLSSFHLMKFYFFKCGE